MTAIATTLTSVLPRSGAGVPTTPHWKPLMTAVIGLSASTHCHFSGRALIA